MISVFFCSKFSIVVQISISSSEFLGKEFFYTNEEKDSKFYPVSIYPSFDKIYFEIYPTIYPSDLTADLNGFTKNLVSRSLFRNVWKSFWEWRSEAFRSKWVHPSNFKAWKQNDRLDLGLRSIKKHIGFWNFTMLRLYYEWVWKIYCN